MRLLLRRLAGWLVLGLIAFVLGHDLVFIVTYGSRYDDALARTGHDASWPVVVLSAMIIAVVGAALAARRLRRLARLARDLEEGRATIARGRAGELWRHVAGLWLGIGPLTAALFVLAENLEHLRAGQGVPGVAVLGSDEYTGLTPIILAAAALLVAVVAALFRWRRDVLLARIAAIGPCRPRGRAGRVLAPAPPALARPKSILGARLAGRAPPVTAAP